MSAPHLRTTLGINAATILSAAVFTFMQWNEGRSRDEAQTSRIVALKTNVANLNERLKEIKDERGRVKISTEADARLRCLEDFVPMCKVPPR